MCSVRTHTTVPFLLELSPSCSQAFTLRLKRKSQKKKRIIGEHCWTMFQIIWNHCPWRIPDCEGTCVPSEKRLEPVEDTVFSQGTREWLCKLHIVHLYGPPSILRSHFCLGEWHFLELCKDTQIILLFIHSVDVLKISEQGLEKQGFLWKGIS